MHQGEAAEGAAGQGGEEGGADGRVLAFFERYTVPRDERREGSGWVRMWQPFWRRYNC